MSDSSDPYLEGFDAAEDVMMSRNPFPLCPYDVCKDHTRYSEWWFGYYERLEFLNGR